MNLDNIKVGDSIKNYLEFCKVFEFEPTKGKGREYHLQEFQKYFKYHMIGQKFIIDEVYKNPIQKEDYDKRLGANSIYMKHEEFILLDYLARSRYKNGYNHIELTVLQIAELTGMCRTEYIENIKGVAGKNPEIEIIDKKSRDMFYQRAASKINGAIKNMINSLKKRFILQVNEYYKIGEYGSNGRLYWRIASTEEDQMIRSAYRSVLKNMGMQTLQDAFLTSRTREFYKNVNEYVRRQYDWWSIYSVYSLGFTEKIEDEVEDYKKTLDEVYEQKLELNSKISGALDVEAVNKFKKNRKEFDEMLNGYFGQAPKSAIDSFDLLDDDYIKNQHLLTDKLIRLPK